VLALSRKQKDLDCIVYYCCLGILQSGGPSWDVPLGRLDSTTAGFDEANEELPSPSSDLDTLITKFRAHGLSFQDLITLSGG
jgi:peroxidase